MTLFLRQILQECFDPSTEIADATVRSNEELADDNSSTAYATVDEYYSSGESVADADELENAVDINGKATEPEETAPDSTTNPEEPAESTVSLTPKRKILSAEDDEMERILKRRVTVVLKRMKFDQNLDEWILPRDASTIETDKASHSGDEHSEEGTLTEFAAKVLQHFVCNSNELNSIQFFQPFVLADSRHGT